MLCHLTFSFLFYFICKLFSFVTQFWALRKIKSSLISLPNLWNLQLVLHLQHRKCKHLKYFCHNSSCGYFDFKLPVTPAEQRHRYPSSPRSFHICYCLVFSVIEARVWVILSVTLIFNGIITNLSIYKMIYVKPSSIYSDSIKPLSVLHSRLKHEWQPIFSIFHG